MAELSIEELLKRAKLYPFWWFGVYSRILNKVRKMVKPKPNICQIRVLEAFEQARKRGIPCRIVVVKPRQIGISTLCAAIAYWIMRAIGCRAVIMGDTDDRSDELFAILQRFIENDQCKWDDGKVLKFTADEITVGESTAEKKTAMKPTATRGGTIQVVIATEAGYYPLGGKLDAEETMTALLNSVPKAPGTVVIIESTANGPAGYFPSVWNNAKWPDWDDYHKRYLDGHEEGTSDYIRVFVAWWEIEEYTFDGQDGRRGITQTESDEIMATLDAKERELIQACQCTVEQLAWRRNTINNECKGSVIKFACEYPSSPGEPFRVSGSPKFDADGLTYLRKLAGASSFKIGLLTDVPFETVVNPNLNGEIIKVPVPGARPTFQPTSEGWLQLWELPKAGCKYIISCDVSGDRDVSPNHSEVKRDRHSSGIIRQGFTDNRGYTFRPRLVGRIKPPCEWGHDLLAKNLNLMSLFFGRCPIAPESNNHGQSLIKSLLKISANVLFHTLIDSVTGKTREVYGFLTTGTGRSARIEVLDHLASSVRRCEIVEGRMLQEQMDCLEILDMHALGEMGTFILNSDGRAEAASGEFDDDVMMLGIGYYLIPSATVYADVPVQRKIPKWDYQVVKDVSVRSSELPPI
jgi:hypothetical protein